MAARRVLPVWLLAAASVPAGARPLRLPRLIWLAVVYLVWDAAALIVLAALWVACRVRLEDPVAARSSAPTTC